MYAEKHLHQRKDKIVNNKELYKKTLALAAPMMIQNGITNAVGLVDNIMVGSLGTEAMSAVSITGQLLFVFSLAIFGGLAGPGIYGAQFFRTEQHGGSEKHLPNEVAHMRLLSSNSHSPVCFQGRFPVETVP